MAQLNREIITNKDGWVLKQTLGTLVCTNEAKKISITYTLSAENHYIIESTNPEWHAKTADIDEFINNSFALVEKLKETVTLPYDIEINLLSMLPLAEETVAKPPEIAQASAPGFNLESITTVEQLYRKLATAISQDNDRHLSAIFQHYFQGKFNAAIQNEFWSYVRFYLSDCLDKVDNISHPAIGHFKTILSQCHQNPPVQQQRNYREAIATCLRILARNDKQLPELQVIELIDLLLQQEQDKDSVLKDNVLCTAAAYSPPKIVIHLLNHAADPKIVDSYEEGRRPIGAALGRFNFGTIELLLNRGAEIKFGLIGSGNDFNTSYNMTINNVFLWLDKAAKEAKFIRDVNQRNQATHVTQIINLSFQAHFCSIENFKKIVVAACENPSSTAWSNLISGIKLGVVLPKPHLTFLISYAAPKLVDPRKLDKFHELFNALSKDTISDMSLSLRDGVEKFLASLAVNQVLTDLQIKQCIYSLFRITPGIADRRDLEWKSKTGEVLTMLFCSNPKILLTAATNGGYGLMKVLLDVLVINASNKYDLTSSGGKDEFLAAIEHGHIRCALLLFETYQKNFHLEELRGFLTMLPQTKFGEANGEYYPTLNAKISEAIDLQRRQSAPQLPHGAAGYSSGFGAPQPSFGRFDYGNPGAAIATLPARLSNRGDPHVDTSPLVSYILKGSRFQ